MTMERHTEELRQDIARTCEVLGGRLELLVDHTQRVLDVRDRIRARPWEAVAAALGTGFILGRLGAENHQQPDPATPPRHRPRRRLSWLADDLDVLANAAAHTALALVRDRIRRQAPDLGATIDRIYEERARSRYWRDY